MKQTEWLVRLTCVAVALTSFRARIGGRLEERRELPGPRNIVTGLNDMTTGAKLKLRDQEEHLFGQAIAGTIRLFTADRERALGSGAITGGLTWLPSRQFTERWGMHVALGYLLTGDSGAERTDDALHQGGAADCRISGPVQTVVKAAWITPDTARDETAVETHPGVRWSASESLTLDAAAGVGVAGPAAAVTATVVRTWAL